MLSTGTSVIIFLVIGVVVMALFCLVTRYFNKKLQKALDDQNQVYSMIEEIRGTEQEEADGQYENYVDNRDKMKGKDKEMFELEMTQSMMPLRGFEDPYNMNKLKRRLDGELVNGLGLGGMLSSIPLNPQTGRSATSLRSFKPDKLDSLRNNNTNTNRSKQTDTNPQDGTQADINSPAKKPRPDRNNKKKQNITKHTYTSKIVAYIEQGIYVIENNLMTITKKDKIQQKRHLKRSTIKPEQTSFEDALQAYGFEKGSFCAFKFSVTLQIPHMKDNEEYPVASLKSSESKEPIQFAQYYSLKDKLQEEV